MKDQKLIKLLNKMFKAKTVNINGDPNQIKKVSVSQNNPLFPLLCNIYLHKLDEFLEKEKAIFGLDLKNYKNPAYKMFSKLRKTSTLKRLQKNNPEKCSIQIKELKIHRNRAVRLANIEKEIKVDKNNVERYYKMYSIRYADNLLIGLKSKKNTVYDFTERLTKFLKNDLHFEIKNTVLKRAKSNYVSFLGFSISVVLKKFKNIEYSRKLNAIIKMRNRIKARKTNFYKKYINYVEKNVKLKITQEMIGLRQHLKKSHLSMTKINKFFKTEFKRLIIAMVGNWVYDMKTKLPDKVTFKKELLTEINLIEKLQKNNQHILNGCIKRYLVGLKEISPLPKEIRKKLNELNELIEFYSSESRLEIDIKKIYASRKNIENKSVMKRKTTFNAAQLATEHSIFIRISIVRILEWLREWNIIKKKNSSPKAVTSIIRFHDIAIIDWFTSKAKGLLHYYKTADNFMDLKRIINYHMNYSLLHTLAAKHRKTLFYITTNFGFNPRLYMKSQKELKVTAQFPSTTKVNSMASRFEIKKNFINELNDLERPTMNLSFNTNTHFFINCSTEDYNVTKVKTSH